MGPILRTLKQDGKLTRWEEKRLLSTATKMQALRRGNVARKEVNAMVALRNTQVDSAKKRKEEIKAGMPSGF